MQISTQKILITGGAGFIGSHLTNLFLSKNYAVTIIDNFSYGKRKFLPVSNKNLSIITCDLLDTDLLQKTFQELNPNTVIHLAAIHHIPTCEQQPEKAIKINIEGTQNVLKALSNTSTGRFIFASSGAVYDIVDDDLCEDTTPVMPYDIYSITKLTGEYLVKNYASRNEIKTVVCRIFNAIGKNETNAHLVPEILGQVRSGKSEIKLGNLTPLRSYIHVMDIAEAIYTLSNTHLNNEFDIFNIGTSDEHSVIDILRLISEIARKNLIPIQDLSKVRKIDRPRQKANIGKINLHAHWSPKHSLKDALSDAYNEITNR